MSVNRENKKPVAFVEAVVRFPLYEEDKRDGCWDWFEYREPGFTENGEIGVCTRLVTVLRAEVKDA